MNNGVWKYILPVTAFLFLLTACKPEGRGVTSTTTGKYKIYKGALHIDIDTGLQPILSQHIDVFSYLHDSIELDVNYKLESEVLKDFEHRATDAVVITRKITPEEIIRLKREDSIYVMQQEVAYDAVALIANKRFNDSGLNMDVLKQYFDPANASGQTPDMVFATQGSSAVRYVISTLGYKEKVSPKVFAASSVQDVVAYVENKENAIGFVPYSSISDADDEQVNSVLKRIKVLSLRAKTKEGKEIRVQANQSDIAEGTYPLIQTITAVTYSTLSDRNEKLFVDFLGRRSGAKIFLKAGLVPAQMYEREIIVNTGALKGGD